MSAYILLIVLALILAIVALIKPGWRLLPVSVILITIALIISRRGF